jgi:hypothetical protein
MAAKKILISYEIWTPEDREHGETWDKGWVDEEGEPMAPDREERREGITAVDKAVAWLTYHHASIPSDWQKAGASRSWTNDKHSEDFETGADEMRTYHLEGFSEKERRKIQREMRKMYPGQGIPNQPTRRYPGGFYLVDTLSGQPVDGPFGLSEGMEIEQSKLHIRTDIGGPRYQLIKGQYLTEHAFRRRR